LNDKKEKGMLGWFTKRKEEVVRMGSRSHGLVVQDAVTELDLAVKAMGKGDVNAAMKCIERLFMAEKEADRLEDKLCADVSGGELSVQEREDLMYFIRKTDQIANWAKEGGIHIQLLKETNALIPDYIWGEIGKMSSELIPTVKHLVKVIENMDNVTNETLKSIEAINDQEKIIDGLYFTCIKRVHLSPMDPRAVMLVRELILALEMAADTCKACADTITIMIGARRV
jgi:predicted phosphate transport protein (TIGR00153 family)